MCPLRVELGTSPKVTIVIQNGQNEIPVEIGKNRLFLSCSPDGRYGIIYDESQQAEMMVFRNPQLGGPTRKLDINVGIFQRGKRKGEFKTITADLRLFENF